MADTHITRVQRTGKDIRLHFADGTKMLWPGHNKTQALAAQGRLDRGESYQPPTHRGK